MARFSALWELFIHKNIYFNLILAACVNPSLRLHKYNFTEYEHKITPYPHEIYNHFTSK